MFKLARLFFTRSLTSGPSDSCPKRKTRILAYNFPTWDALHNAPLQQSYSSPGSAKIRDIAYRCGIDSESVSYRGCHERQLLGPEWKAKVEGSQLRLFKAKEGRNMKLSHV
jgi:hypothetical protein